MATTSIEWTDTTWNPTTGCDRISPGCDNCYALTMARRLKGMGQAKYQTDGDPRTSGPGFGIAGHPDVLDEPLQWRKPRRVFVNSMSDLFHARVTTELVTRVWEVMAKTPQHTYQVLTKRASRLAPVLAKVHAELGLSEPLPNVWLGTSVENQKYADLRIPALLNAPAAVRFLSCEPLLGPIDLFPGDHAGHERDWDGTDAVCLDCSTDEQHIPWRTIDRTDLGIDWVIVGGESGPGARPMHPEWARSLRDQCQQAKVPFLFKQWGAWAPTGYRVGKKAAGRELDGRTWDEYPAA